MQWTSEQAKKLNNMASKANMSEYTIKEAMRAWAELMKMTEGIQQIYEEEIGRLRRRVMELEAEAKRAQISKTWIQENLEEAQEVIDNIVGIKGVTEDPMKAASEAGISRYQHEPQPQPQPQPHVHVQMPRVSISSQKFYCAEELFGY